MVIEKQKDDGSWASRDMTEYSVGTILELQILEFN